MILRAFLCLTLLSSGAIAQDRLSELRLRSQTLGLEAVGRLDLPEGGYCTGVLVDNDLVLTAAHCLLRDGVVIDPREIIFQAGMRRDEAVASRAGLRAVMMPDFSLGGEDALQSIRSDVALVQLESGIPLAVAAPFETSDEVEQGDLIEVVSVGQGRRHTLSREAGCEVTDAYEQVMAFSCDVDHGSSGAPVFKQIGFRAKIVSIISRGYRDGDKTVSFGTEVAPAVEQLRADLYSGRGVFPVTVVEGRSVTVGGKKEIGGARFIKP
ncbi:trypsin-like serine peptidase [Actibacterium pelagium]|uniref:Serine protease n=1 Tax=Actibacterium pelagium TaxID=2029103 RepID=A0A917AHF1_9RHOB|nr:serine protease [Actibacterium pelagium]GGE53131.1 serine protease [Actibacterium pelagium]